MKDLTQGSIPKHVIEMAVPMAVGMLVQTLYFLVDLYFVGRLGDVALAGVSAAGNTMFMIIALTQILGVAVALLQPSGKVCGCRSCPVATAVTRVEAYARNRVSRRWRISVPVSSRPWATPGRPCSAPLPVF